MQAFIVYLDPNCIGGTPFPHVFNLMHSLFFGSREYSHAVSQTRFELLLVFLMGGFWLGKPTPSMREKFYSNGISLWHTIYLIPLFG
jgi:hypothetical protein